MKNLFLAFALVIIAQSCFAQIKFEPGYFISNGTRTSCLIKNVDWKNNPTQFEYKMGSTANTEKGSIENVTEFGISKYSRYIRYTVDIDQSPEDVSKLSENKDPEFIKQTVYLKALTEGKASLYKYESGDLVRYFFNLDSLQPFQLIHKPYRADQTHIGENDAYKNQLSPLLTCTDITITDLEKLEYKDPELEKIISRFNSCDNSESISYNQKTKKDLFNLNVRPGLNITSLTTINDVLVSGNYDFGTKATFRLGLEAEIIMPFQRNKWALIAEPVYQYYKASIPEGNRVYKADYKSLEINAGIRHYFFLNDLSKIFLNATLILDYPFNSTVNAGTTDLEVAKSLNSSFGAGYKFKDHFSAELKYQFKRELFNNYVSWFSEYKTISVVFGYTLF